MIKSLISSILSICLLFSLSSFAFAEDLQNEGQSELGSAEAALSVIVSVESESPETSSNGGGNNPTNTVEQSVSESVSEVLVVSENTISENSIVTLEATNEIAANDVVDEQEIQSTMPSNKQTIIENDSQEEIIMENEPSLLEENDSEIVFQKDELEEAPKYEENDTEKNSQEEIASEVEASPPEDSEIKNTSPEERKSDENSVLENSVASPALNVSYSPLATSIDSAPYSHITVDKSTTSSPENKAKYEIGDRIDYTITITNDGNIPLTNVRVYDDLTKETWTFDTLAPNATETVTTSHVVSDQDVLKSIADAAGAADKTIVNNATVVSANTPDGVADPEKVNGRTEDPVRSDYPVTVNYILRNREKGGEEELKKYLTILEDLYYNLPLSTIIDNGNPEMAGLKYLDYDKTDEIEVIFADEEPARSIFTGNIDNAIFRMGAGNNIIDIYYEQYEVRVHFVASDTGETLADDYVAYYRSGNEVNPVAAKGSSIDGYKPQIPYVYLEGAMPAGDINVTIFYDKEIPEIIIPGGSQESSYEIADYYPDYSNSFSAKEDTPSEIAADGVSIPVPISGDLAVTTEDLHNILVELDGNKVSTNDYTASVDESGELIVIFSADFIKTLSKGTHTIAVKILNEIHYITLTID